MTATFQHDGIQFPYERIGQGEPFVFGHGLGGNRQQPKDLAGAVPGHQLIVWDSRGHGETQPVRPPEKICFVTLADDLAALLDHLEIKRAVIGGISMGAGVAANFAVRWPERMLGLILVRPAWLGSSPCPRAWSYLRGSVSS